MFSHTVAAIFVFIWSILSKNSTGLDVSSYRVTRSTGDQVRLNCSDPSTNSLYWIYKSVGSTEPAYVYSPGLGLLKNYQRAGRHRVEVEHSSGSCNLLIERLSIEDAGTYICRTDNGEHLDIELIIIDSRPECRLNSSLTDVLVENDCDMEPDLIELTCSLFYHGNVPPKLKWHHSSKYDTKHSPSYNFISSSTISHLSITEGISKVVHTVNLTSNIQLNGTHFICSVDETDIDEQSYGCNTRNITVSYCFNSTEIRAIEISDGGNISCVANTSESCNYRWHGTSTSTNLQVEVPGPTINLVLFKKDFEVVRCLAECRIRDQWCIVEPLVLKLSETNDGSRRRLNIPLLTVIIIIIIISIFLWIWWFKRFRDRNRTVWKKETDTELQPPLDKSDVIQDQVRKLVECLPSDKLCYYLELGGVVTDEKFKSSIEEPQGQEYCVKILTSIIDTRTKFNSLLSTVITLEENYHYLEHSSVTESIQKNIHKLVECLDVDNGLADSLFSQGVLTSEQYERLTNKLFLPSYQEKNRELLTNMLPSRLKSTYACKMFMAALVETDQRHIFNFIMNSHDNVTVTDHDDRILTSDELMNIDRNLSHMINLIDLCPTMLKSLLRNNCITPIHKDRIDVQLTKRDKNKELLSIMRRRSYEDFKTFERVIQATQNGGMIIKLLEQQKEIWVRPLPV